MRQDAQKSRQKFCAPKTAKKRKTHPEKPEKGETGCFLGAGGGGSGWKRMRADGKTRSLKRNAPNNHATQAKRKPAKTQCFRRFCGRGRRTWSRLPARVLLPGGERPAPTGAGAEASAAERHWRSLTPRHAVLEWMWKQRTESGGGTRLRRSTSQVTKRAVLVWCCQKKRVDRACFCHLSQNNCFYLRFVL